MILIQFPKFLYLNLMTANSALLNRPDDLVVQHQWGHVTSRGCTPTDKLLFKKLNVPFLQVKLENWLTEGTTHMEASLWSIPAVASSLKDILLVPQVRRDSDSWCKSFVSDEIKKKFELKTSRSHVRFVFTNQAQQTSVFSGCTLKTLTSDFHRAHQVACVLH